jgi:hypothetical protein
VVAQGSVVRIIAASYGKSFELAFRRNKTPSNISTKIGVSHHVGNVNNCVNFYFIWLDKGVHHAYVKYNDSVTEIV